VQAERQFGQEVAKKIIDQSMQGGGEQLPITNAR
jgi:hypothetical protein